MRKWRRCRKCGSQQFRWKLADDEPGKHTSVLACLKCGTEVPLVEKVDYHHPAARCERLQDWIKFLESACGGLDVLEKFMVKGMLLIEVFIVLVLVTWHSLK